MSKSKIYTYKYDAPSYVEFNYIGNARGSGTIESRVRLGTMNFYRVVSDCPITLQYTSEVRPAGTILSVAEGEIFNYMPKQFAEKADRTDDRLITLEL